MSFTILPKAILLPLDYVKIGRFISNLEQPQEGYHDASYAAKLLTPIETTFKSKTSKEKEKGVGLDLPNLISTRLTRSIGESAELEFTHGRSYSMDNSDGWFEEVVGEADTRKWIERAAIRRRKVYLVVGYQTVTDANLTLTAKKGHEIGGDITLPISLALTAAGFVMPFGTGTDPQVSSHMSGTKESHITMTAPGERICALYYRAVCYKWFSSRTVQHASLASTLRWSCIEGSTRQGYDPEDSDASDDELEDMIQVDLSDNLSDGLPDDDGGWTAEETANGVFHFHSDIL